ncbi:MAG TPA: hypothetical protein VLY87_01835 [Flavobacterium sp.]|nr:hypothetical protein [Flavobacterium sp.]
MKKSLILLFTLISATTLVSCIFEREDIDTYNYYPSRYNPVIMSRDAFEKSIVFKDVQPMKNAGKIYVKDQYVFIVDKNKGVHVYNNQNPNNPTEYAYLEIPGVTDLAIRNNNIFVNQSVDLVALNVNFNAKTVEVTKRIRQTFPIKVSPDGYTQYVEEDKVVVDWIKRN